MIDVASRYQADVLRRPWHRLPTGHGELRTMGRDVAEVQDRVLGKTLTVQLRLASLVRGGMVASIMLVGPDGASAMWVEAWNRCMWRHARYRLRDTWRTRGWYLAAERLGIIARLPAPVADEGGAA